ncbi:Hsp33 family molecular chaperone [Phreatobacter sp.]|uniref:Hsp33 family molecular chaperone n=1 Tax=Phreatobacter sp. TaxID=1966341 RepID=UPI003F704E42
MTHIPDLTHGADDIVVPFQVDELDLRGRLVRLGRSATSIIDRHGYPPEVARVVAEATALTLLLGSGLKFDGRLILQTQTDGPIRMVVVDVSTPDRVRALARYDADRVNAAVAAGESDPARLIGAGQLVMTIDQGADMQRYQGIVPLEGEGLERAADRYFLQSEQIDTRVRLAVAEEVLPGEDGPRTAWRAGGVLVQHFPPSGGHTRDLDPGDAPDGTERPEPAEAWAEARALTDTIGDDELVDRTVSPERLLFRLFHERGVRVFEAQGVTDHCTCSRERIENLVQSFSREERRDMVEDGHITVTCEYCSSSWRFAPSEFDPVE